MQQLNAVCGGGQYADLARDRPDALPHADSGGEPARHTVFLEPGTHLRTLYGANEIRVPSAHLRAVRQIGAGLRVGARAPDGVIEALEAVDPGWFCVGVQWQPVSPRDFRLFESLVRACGAQVEPLTLAA
jgi:putative glutamine amidotransferase